MLCNFCFHTTDERIKDKKCPLKPKNCHKFYMSCMFWCKRLGAWVSFDYCMFKVKHGMDGCNKKCEQHIEMLELAEEYHYPFPQVRNWELSKLCNIKSSRKFHKGFEKRKTTKLLKKRTGLLKRRRI